MKKISILIILLIVGLSEVMAYDFATESTQILNNIQLIITAARELQSLSNQQVQIQNQIVGLQAVANYQNQFGAINANSGQISILINLGINNSNQTEALLTQMQQAATNILNSGTTSQETIQLAQGTMQIVQNAQSAVQTQRQDYQLEQNNVNALLAKSNSAVGQTQAIQTLNQLVGQMIQQQQLTRELINQLINLQTAQINQDTQDKQDGANLVNQIYQPVPAGQSSFSYNSSWP
jgi:conjugal transfer/entry exclusion protein